MYIPEAGNLSTRALLSHFKSTVTSSFHDDGLRAASARAAGMIGRRLIPHQMRGSLILRKQRQYELKYGVDVGQDNSELVSDPSLLYGDNLFYGTVPFTKLEKLFTALPIDPREYSFIDLGCGKGAALILAVEGRFQAVIGVEFDPELTAIASRNLERVHAVRPTSCTTDIVNSDAAKYRFPLVPSLIFMANPFGEKTMRTVLRNIEESFTWTFALPLDLR
jgi:SAM-dependent methyltransferase